jgi:hypothetical protein
MSSSASWWGLIRSISDICISKEQNAAHRKHQLLPASPNRKKRLHQFGTSLLPRNAQSNFMPAWDHPATCSEQRLWLGHLHRGGLPSSQTDSPRSFKIRTIPCETSSQSRFQVIIEMRLELKRPSKAKFHHQHHQCFSLRSEHIYPRTKGAWLSMFRPAMRLECECLFFIKWRGWNFQNFLLNNDMCGLFLYVVVCVLVLFNDQWNP